MLLSTGGGKNSVVGISAYLHNAEGGKRMSREYHIQIRSPWMPNKMCKQLPYSYVLLLLRGVIYH